MATTIKIEREDAYTLLRALQPLPDHVQGSGLRALIDAMTRVGKAARQTEDSFLLEPRGDFANDVRDVLDAHGLGDDVLTLGEPYTNPNPILTPMPFGPGGASNGNAAPAPEGYKHLSEINQSLGQ